MPEHRVHFEPGFRFTYAQDQAISLEALMRRHGLTIRAGSMLERATLSIFDMVDRYHDLSPDRAFEDIRQPFRELVGLTELAALILGASSHPSFPALLKHLHLLNAGSAIQNTRSMSTDQATNKVFELFCATLAMRCGIDVLLDDPESSEGDNPDVLFTIDDRRWGVACKVLHSPHPQTFVDRLSEGIAQIERSEASIGIVVVNLKNLIHHDEYWPIQNADEWKAGAEPRFGCFVDPAAPFNQLLKEAQLVGVRMKEHIDRPTLEGLFLGKKAIPGYLLWSHTVCGILRDGLPVVSSVRVMNFQTVEQPPEHVVSVLECLHKAVFADHDGDPL